jgi:hypothetical protein
MLSDALTKAMVSPQLLRLLTCGKVDFHNVPDHPVKTRTLPTLPIEEESDLLLTDEEVMKVAELKPNKVTTTAASILLGLITGATFQKLMVASTMVAMTTAATAQPLGGNNADDGDHGGHLALYITLFLTAVLAIIVEKFISGFFRKLPTGHLTVPKVELIRTPATKRHRDGEEEDEMAEPVEDMDVDEIGGLPMSPRTARLFYERAKKMREDYVKLSKEKIHRPRMTMSGGPTINDAEYYKSQIDEEKEMLKNMTTNRDVFRHDGRMWHDRFDQKAEEAQKFQEVTDLYNEAVRLKHEVEGQIKRADKDLRTRPSRTSRT